MVGIHTSFLDDIIELDVEPDQILDGAFGFLADIIRPGVRWLVTLLATVTVAICLFLIGRSTPAMLPVLVVSVLGIISTTSAIETYKQKLSVDILDGHGMCPGKGGMARNESGTNLHGHGHWPSL